MNKLSASTLVILLAACLSISLTQAQVTNINKWDNKCPACVYYAYNYCSDNRCYQGKPSNLTCSNQTESCVNLITTTFTRNTTYTISQLAIADIFSQNFVEGESLSFKVKSQAEKSSFINLTYSNPNLKTDKKKVLFYVYNENIPDKKFEMSYLDSVLLPNSKDNFIVWLAAVGGDFTVKVTASNSVRTIVGFVSVAIAGLALF